MVDATKQESVMDKVRKLLTLAERTPFEAEAEAFTEKAHALMTKYAIDQAMLAAFQAHAGTGLVPEPQEMIVIFSENKMHILQKRTLFHVVAMTNRCDSVFIESHGSTQRVHLFGFKEDMEFAQILFTSLMVQMVREADRKLAEARRTQVIKNGYAWKRNFFIGFADGVYGRLQRQQRRIIADVEAKSTGTELLLADRSLAVKRKVRDFYPHLGRGRASRATDGSVVRLGEDAGRRADVSGGRRGSRIGGLGEIGS